MSLSILDSLTVERLGSTLLHFLWQGAVIAALHGLCQAMLRRQSSAVRYLAAGVMLLASLACATMTFQALKPDLEPIAAAAAPMQAPSFSSEMAPQPVETAKSLVTPIAEPIRAPTAAPSARIDWEIWAVWAWLCGVVVLSVRLALGWTELMRLRQRATAVADAVWQRRLTELAKKLGVRQKVALLSSSRLDSPMTLGWWRPVILIPVSMLSNLPRAQVEMILAHELAHIRRGDFLVHVLQCLVETLLFFHPVIWWIGRDLRRLREECCDDLALQCGRREDLARALLALEEVRGLSLAQCATGSSTLARVRRLLGVHPQPVLRWRNATGGVLVTAFTLALLLHTAFAADVITVKPGESIQKAIDAAPEGAVVKIEAGVFPERITIRKAVTLEGAGDSKTILRPDKLEPGVTQETLAAALKRWQAASSEEEKLKSATEYQEKYQRPTILVKEAKEVRIRGLRIQGMAPKSESEERTQGALTIISASGVTMEACAIVGPQATGLIISEDAQVRVSKCLVAAIWGTGIAIDRGLLGKGTAPTVDIEDSDIRNCYHRCITISPKCDDVRIRRCLVSGSAWHGIRYDAASPVIEQNIIFANARSGIYASGETHAKVTGNLFHSNEMDAISCWFANHDEISSNTFAGNLREGVSVLGASKPSFHRNIFALNPISLHLGAIGGDRSKAVGEIESADNVTWKNDKDTKPPPGTREADPKFIDATGRDFRLAADSPMRAEKIGAADLPSPNSPWPLQAEEKAMVPVTSTRNYSDWQKPGKPNAAAVDAEKVFQQARTAADPWTRDILQIDDSEKRHNILEAVRAGLSSRDLATQLKALITFNRVSVVEFDRAPFRAVLLPLLESTNSHLSIGACRALKSCGFQPGDLERLLKLASTDDPSVLENITPYLVEASKNKLTPEMEPVLLKVLGAPMIDRQRKSATGENLTRDNMKALGQLDLTPALKARVLELSNDPESRIYRLAFHHALAPQKLRTGEDIDMMAAFLVHEDTLAVVPRALWAFEQVTSGDFKPQIASLMTRFIEARADATLRASAVKILSATANAEQLAFCENRLKKPGLPAEERQMLETIVARLKTKK